MNAVVVPPVGDALVVYAYSDLLVILPLGFISYLVVKELLKEISKKRGED